MQCSQNFFGITVLQFAGHLHGSSLVALYHTWCLSGLQCLPGLWCLLLQDLLELTPKIYIYIYPFHHRGLECRSRKARNTRNNRHFGLGVQNEGGQRLTELCQENTLVTTNTLSQKHKRQLYTWTSPDGQYQNQIDYILCSQRRRSSTQPAKTRPGADCGSDHTLLTRKFRLKLKKVGKTTRPYRYDLNQIP